MCDCLETLAPSMREKGLWIDSTLQSRQAAVSLSFYPGYRRRRGEKLPVMLAVYCPFCGEQYGCDTERLSEPRQAPLLPPE